MELMIKHSEFLTIVIQAFLITVAGFIFVSCWNELLEENNLNIKRLKRKIGRLLVKEKYKMIEKLESKRTYKHRVGE